MEGKASVWSVIAHWALWSCAFALLYLVTFTILGINVPVQGAIGLAGLLIGAAAIALPLTFIWRHEMRRDPGSKTENKAKLKNADAINKPDSRLGNFVNGIILLALGSIGPLGTYYYLLDPDFGAKLSPIGYALTTFGVVMILWYVTGVGIAGIHLIWCAAQNQTPPKDSFERITSGWAKVGWWLLAIAIAAAILLFIFGSLGSFFGHMSGGTLLIAGLLFLILLALWQISHQLNQRR